MIRIRIKPTHVTVRIDGGAKQRYASAIQALHVIRVGVVEDGHGIEGTKKTQAALVSCVHRARAEIEAAVQDLVAAPIAF